MTYIGKVHNGTVVLPPQAQLPEGTSVRIEPIASESVRKNRTERLRQIAKSLEGLPADLAKNHDHYLYGTPKR